MLPEAGRLEAEVLGGVLVPSELPFPSDRGGVSGLFQLMGKGGLLPVQPAELDVVADIILPGHDLYPGGRADRVGKAVGKAHAFRRQLVKVG